MHLHVFLLSLQKVTIFMTSCLPFFSEESTLQGINLLLDEQILSFKSRPLE